MDPPAHPPAGDGRWTPGAAVACAAARGRQLALAGAALLVLCLTACQPTHRSTVPSNPQAQRTDSALARERPEPLRTGYSPTHSANFDYYLLNLSWSPEFCYKHSEAPECAEHRTFTLHGLWPQRLDGTYPEHCSEQPPPADPERFRDLYPDAGLLRHEWETHGTCSGLDPDSFFIDARSAVRALHVPPQLASLDHQISLAPEAILSAFIDSNPGLPRASLALSCGNNFLTAVEVCLNKQLQPMSCGPVRSCRANAVRILPVRH